MARLSSQVLLAFVFLCVVACGAGARGGGARFRSGGRYSYRGGGIGVSSSTTGANTGMIVGIVFGVIGGIIVLVVIIILCRIFIFKKSSVGSTGAQTTGAQTTTTLYNLQATSLSDNSSDYKPSYDNAFSEGVEPPSYESAVNQKEGALPYSSEPNSNLPYPNQPYPLGPSMMAYSPQPAALYNQAEPCATSVPSYHVQEGGPENIGFGKSSV